MLYRIQTLVLLAIVAVTAAGQQVRPGDYILGDLGPGSRGVVYVYRNTGFLGTMMQLPANQYMNGVVMESYLGYNADILSVVPRAVVGTITRAPHIAKTSWNNVVTKVKDLPMGIEPVDILHDQDGSWVVASSTGSVLRVYLTLTTTILSSLPPTLKAMTIDQDTGDLILGFSGTSMLMRAKLGSLALSTIATGLGFVSDVDFEPETGNYVVATGTSPEIRVVTPSGQTVTTIQFPGAKAVKVHPVTGNYVCASANTITEFTSTGTVVKSYTFSNTFNFTSIDVYGSLPVTGAGTAQPRTQYLLFIGFPGSGAGQSYYGALSFGMRPGITIPGLGKVNLAADPLFFLSFYYGGVPGITFGLSGTLKAGGRAVASVVLPRDVPIGLRVHVSAVATTGNVLKPLAFGNTWSWTVMP